jgi:uncharacterized membrane protein
MLKVNSLIMLMFVLFWLLCKTDEIEDEEIRNKVWLFLIILMIVRTIKITLRYIDG